jgi:hypothetical protein
MLILAMVDATRKEDDLWTVCDTAFVMFRQMEHQIFLQLPSQHDVSRHHGGRAAERRNDQINFYTTGIRTERVLRAQLMD